MANTKTSAATRLEANKVRRAAQRKIDLGLIQAEELGLFSDYEIEVFLKAWMTDYVNIKRDIVASKRGV